MTSKTRLTRKQLVEFFNENGFPTALSTLEKLGSPAINQGPPVSAWWGRRPLYDPQEALAWAESKLRPAGGQPLREAR